MWRRKLRRVSGVGWKTRETARPRCQARRLGGRRWARGSMPPIARMAGGYGRSRVASTGGTIGLRPLTPHDAQQPDPIALEQHPPWPAAQSPSGRRGVSAIRPSSPCCEARSCCSAALVACVLAPESWSAPDDPAPASTLPAAKISTDNKTRRWENADFISSR